MATTKLKWYGDDLLAKITGVSEEGLYAGAEEILTAAQAKTPVDTGTLRDSGYVATEKRSTYQKKDKVHRKELKAEPGMALAAFAAFYAHMVERGTKKMAARPFLRSALDSTKRRAGVKVVEVMRSRMRR